MFSVNAHGVVWFKMHRWGENQVNSCCKIYVLCSSDNEHYFEWTTGLCIFKISLVLAILATGMEGSKVLPLFEALKILNVKQRELSRILTCYTILAIYNVWNAEQLMRLQRQPKGSPL